MRGTKESEGGIDLEGLHITYGVAMICRLLKNTGLFCKRDYNLQKRPIILTCAVRFIKESEGGIELEGLHITYGVAMISRLLKNTDLFCRILSLS